MAKLPISVQSYTLRELTSVDFAGAMKKVAGVGYRYVELAGWGNLKSAGDVRKALNDAGLKASGAHVGIDAFNKDLPKVLADAQTIGYSNLIVPWIGQDYYSAAGYQRLARVLNAIGQQVKSAGMELYYHNHSFEFAEYDGRSGFDILWDNSDPALVKAELDVYWIQHGKVDPVAYIKTLGNRVGLLHLKDMDKADPNKFTQVGKGLLDIPAIVAAGVDAGARFGVVEQDNCYDVPPLESITVSLGNLRKMGLAA